jgi:hypothetical protein
MAEYYDRDIDLQLGQWSMDSNYHN